MNQPDVTYSPIWVCKKGLTVFCISQFVFALASAVGSRIILSHFPVFTERKEGNLTRIRSLACANTHTQRKGVVETKGLRRVTKRKEETTERSIPGRKEAECFLRGQSEIPLQFMKTVEDCFPRLQEPTAGLSSTPDKHTQRPSCFIHVYCNSIFPPTQGFSKWCLYFRCCYQNSM